MPCVNKYPKPFIEECKKLLKVQLSSYEKISVHIKDEKAKNEFEKNYCADHYFMHRMAEDRKAKTVILPMK